LGVQLPNLIIFDIAIVSREHLVLVVSVLYVLITMIYLTINREYYLLDTNMIFLFQQLRDLFTKNTFRWEQRTYKQQEYKLF
jgi:hypothetical protein